MDKETEATDGKSLEEPTLKEALAAKFDELESKDDTSEEKPDEKPDSEEPETVEAAEDTEQEEGDPKEKESKEPDPDTTEADWENDGGGDNTEGAETVTTVEEHWTEEFKGVVSGLGEDEAKIVRDTIKFSDSRADKKFEESAEARKFYENMNVSGLKTSLPPGATPESYYNGLIQVEQAFNRDPEGTLVYMMQQAGLNNAEGIQKLQTKLGLSQTEEDIQDPDLKAVLDKVSGLENKLAQNETNRTQQQSQEANAAIEVFKNETSNDQLAHPHFEQVKDSMGALMNAGQAQDIQEAYDKAVRMDSELFKGILKESEKSMVKAKEAKRIASVEKSKAASRNVTGKKPSHTEKDYPDDIRKHLAMKYDELDAG